MREHALREPQQSYWLCLSEPASYGATEVRRHLVRVQVDELLDRWPRTIGERIDRTLLNCIALARPTGSEFGLDGVDYAVGFASSSVELQLHLDALFDQGLMCEVEPPHDAAWGLRVTPRGYMRGEELSRSERKQTNPVFVAMSFGGDTVNGKRDSLDLFQNGIRQAVLDAGYVNAIRSDLDEHNNSVIDEVIARMRVAPFVVADFAGHRNGVYYEAGFARGYGTPVIHTCHESEIRDAHFDTSSLQHVVYTSVEDLRTKLRWRILNSVGVGPDARKAKEWLDRPSG